jgi:hypothetical protein
LESTDIHESAITSDFGAQQCFFVVKIGTFHEDLWNLSAQSRTLHQLKKQQNQRALNLFCWPWFAIGYVEEPCSSAAEEPQS